MQSITPGYRSVLGQLVLLTMLFGTLAGCVASRMETLTDYTPPADAFPHGYPTMPRDERIVEAGHFLSWEPYHFIVTLGVLPQYGYAVFEMAPGEYVKHERMIGWLATILPLVSDWEYGKREVDGPPEETGRPSP